MKKNRYINREAENRKELVGTVVGGAIIAAGLYVTAICMFCM